MKKFLMGLIISSLSLQSAHAGEILTTNDIDLIHSCKYYKNCHQFTQLKLDNPEFEYDSIDKDNLNKNLYSNNISPEEYLILHNNLIVKNRDNMKKASQKLSLAIQAFEDRREVKLSQEFIRYSVMED
mgnify:CR=1 FL=1